MGNTKVLDFCSVLSSKQICIKYTVWCELLNLKKHLELHIKYCTFWKSMIWDHCVLPWSHFTKCFCWGQKETGVFINIHQSVYSCFFSLSVPQVLIYSLWFSMYIIDIWLVDRIKLPVTGPTMNTNLIVTNLCNKFYSISYGTFLITEIFIPNNLRIASGNIVPQCRQSYPEMYM